MRKKSWLLLGVGVQVLAGCSDDRCGDECTEGLACAEVIDVPADKSLDAAAAEAAAGTCIALAPGSYGEVTLPGGAILTGGDAADTTVGSVTLLAGAASVVRGVHVAGVVKVRADAVDVRLERLLVTGSKNGVQAEAGASFTLVDSELRDVPENAVLIVDAARARIERTSIVNSGGPGIWAQCSAGCACASPPVLELAGVTLSDNAFVALSLHGVNASLAGVTITHPRAAGFQYGGGVAAAACSTVNAQGLTVDGAESFGLLMDSASGHLGGMGDENGIIIINNRGGGVWFQKVVDPLTLENATLSDNAVSGIDIGGGSRGIIIINNRVGGTASASFQAIGYIGAAGTPAPVGLQTIGDGLIWGEDAEVQIDGLTLSGSGRNAFLIDGAVASGSTVANVVLEAGDDAKGIVQQRASGAAEGPETTNAPDVQQSTEALHDVPVAPQPPEAIGS
jgi:hypothetical protein